MNNTCLLCRRMNIYTDRHHLIPRHMHTRIKNRKSKHIDLFKRKDETIRLCRPCHSKLHRLWDEKLLAFKYNTLDVILEQEDVQRWINWIKNKPIDFKPKK